MKWRVGAVRNYENQSHKAVPFVSLDRVHAPIMEEFSSALAATVSSSDFILGESLDKFEQEFSSYLGGGCEVIGVGNGTDAIEIALRALELPKNSEVLVPSNSFIASATGVIRAGLVPRFVEPNPQTLLVDGWSFRESVTRKTSAILVVHLFGNVVDISELVDFAAEKRIALVEDVAQAHGATLRGRHVGTLGDIAATSFYPGKNLGALGDGGAVITSSQLLAKRSRLIRNYGSATKYRHDMFGFNSRLDSLQARFLSAKLPYLDQWNEDRRRVASRYDSFFSGKATFSVPVRTPNTQPVHHLYPVTTKRRDELAEHLRASGVGYGIHYPVPIPLLPPFSKMKSTRGDFEVSVRIANSLISLPIFPGMTENELGSVFEALERFICH